MLDLETATMLWAVVFRCCHDLLMTSATEGQRGGADAHQQVQFMQWKDELARPISPQASTWLPRDREIERRPQIKSDDARRQQDLYRANQLRGR